MKKNLTNAELIAILSKRDQNAPVDILVDWCVWNGDPAYPDVDENSGVCYDDEYDQLVVSAGEFEC